MSSFFTASNDGPFHYVFTRLTVAFLVVTWTSFALRVWVRRKYLGDLGFDDGFMLLALILFTVYGAVAIVAMYIFASGRVLLEYNRFTTIYPIASSFSSLTNVSLKLSLCFFFLRVLHQKYARYIVILATTISTIANLIGFLFFLIPCGGPRQVIQMLFQNICSNQPYISVENFRRLAMSLPIYTNVSVDIIFALIPIPMLMQSTLGRRQRIVVCIYLALATIGSVCATAKSFYTVGDVVDLSKVGKTIQIYACFNTSELASYIIGGCIAAYRPLFKAIGRRMNTSVTNGSGSGNRSGSRTLPKDLPSQSYLERSRNSRHIDILSSPDNYGDKEANTEWPLSELSTLTDGNGNDEAIPMAVRHHPTKQMQSEIVEMDGDSWTNDSPNENAGENSTTDLRHRRSDET